ncbi:MAG: GC-type dockerin domain-anchored protein [Phycisphaerales bacterium]
MSRRLLAAALLAASGSFARATEVVVQNDGFTGGSGVNLCWCFAPSEEAAVWLTSPCDGAIVGFQIYWRSQFSAADPSIEGAIKIYEGGSHPNPGALIDELLAPVLTDGFLNEFRYVDDQFTIPINIPVAQGETFVVSLEFFNDNQGAFDQGTIGSDNDGCQGGKNAVKVGGFFWTNACSLGVSGDWVIRAIIDCGGAAGGACCLPDGSCADGMSLADCQAANGYWNGPGTQCSDAAVTCEGACYVPTTMSCLQFNKTTCDAVGGEWQGPGTEDCNTCPADVNGDGTLNLDDVNLFASAFLAQSPVADINGDGAYNLDDINGFASGFVAGCP